MVPGASTTAMPTCLAGPGRLLLFISFSLLTSHIPTLSPSSPPAPVDQWRQSDNYPPDLTLIKMTVNKQ